MNVTIFADASFCPTEKVGGYGYWVASGRGKKSGGGRLRSEVIQSATVAEMMALVNALHGAILDKLVRDGDSILFQTDCVAAIDAFEGKRVRLIEQEQQVLLFMSRLAAKGQLKLQYRHVKGHTGGSDRRSTTNHLCDKRAKQGLKLARNAKKINGLRKIFLEK